jgi:hypothetical protein
MRMTRNVTRRGPTADGRGIAAVYSARSLS